MCKDVKFGDVKTEKKSVELYAETKNGREHIAQAFVFDPAFEEILYQDPDELEEIMEESETELEDA